MGAIIPVIVLAAIAAAAGGGKKRRRGERIPEFEWTEDEAVEMAIASGGTLSEMANDAYWTSHPECPIQIDPNNPDHIDCIEIWKSLYDQIEEALRPAVEEDDEEGVPDPSEAEDSIGTGHPDEGCMEAQSVSYEMVTGIPTAVTFSQDGRAQLVAMAEAGPVVVRSEDEPCMPPKNRGVDFAFGSDGAIWPLVTSDSKNEYVVSYRDVMGDLHGKWGRDFSSKRKSKVDGEIVPRYHAGVDLFADEGDLVTATEDGDIVRILPFHHGTWAIYQITDTGLMVMYGEVKKNSWTQFGIRRGQLPLRVLQGDAIAEVGLMSGGSSMLHLETYRPDTDIDQEVRKGKLRWFDRDYPPEKLLDPSLYLVQASTNSWTEDQLG